MPIKIAIGIAALCISNLLFAQQTSKNITIPFVDIEQNDIGIVDANDEILRNGREITSKKIGDGVYYIHIKILSAHNSRIKRLDIPMRFLKGRSGIGENVKQSFHWLPNLKQGKNDFISQHVFRSPCLMAMHKDTAVSVIPDLVIMEKYRVAPYYLDMQMLDSNVTFHFGLSYYNVKSHQYYYPVDSLFTLPEIFEMGIYVLCMNKTTPFALLEKTNHFLWSRNGNKYCRSVLPQVIPYKEYAAAGYSMALEKYWVDGKLPNTGGITLSTLLDSQTNQYRGRLYKDDLWYHSWFNNIRTAYGLYQWGNETNNDQWRQKAVEMVNMFLTVPVNKGFFLTIWVPANDAWISSGQGGGEGLYHVPDNVWTALWLLRFSDELKPISASETLLHDFSMALLKIQNKDGSFPARIHVKDFSADSLLQSSASGAIVTWFLEEMLLRKKINENETGKVKEAIRRSLNYLEKNVLPDRRFEDFEVYFSCSPKPRFHYYDSITSSYPQNTLSIQWCAEALLKAHLLFNDKRYLEEGEYCLQILSLYQQVWNPSYINFYAFGGFGAQNSDAEWSDARQAQFAETFMNYYFATHKKEYLERAVYACRASFALMAIPENKTISPMNYQGHVINGEYRGAMAENFGHSGFNERSHQSGFHWGTGSALTTAAIFKKQLGDIYIDEAYKTAIGVDGVVINKADWSNGIRLSTTRVKNKEHLQVRENKKIKGNAQVIIDGSIYKLPSH